MVESACSIPLCLIATDWFSPISAYDSLHMNLEDCSVNFMAQDFTV